MTKHIYIGVAILAVAIIGGMVLHAYIGSVVGGATQQQLKSDVSQRIDAMQAELKDALDAISKQKQDVKTPQEVVRYIPQYVNLPSPPIIQQGQGGENSKPSEQHSLPDAPSSAQGVYFPPEDVKPLFDKLADGKACELKLGECQKEIPLLEQRASAAEKAMKGGGFWRRLKSNSKWFVIGGITGAAAVAATRR